MAQRPYVKINYLDFPGVDTILNRIRAGLEEAGVPFEFAAVSATGEHPGYIASRESPLRVGIGVDKNKNIALFHAQAGDTPVMTIKNVGETDARMMGENAGRLVMGMPLVFLSE